MRKITEPASMYSEGVWHSIGSKFVRLAKESPFRIFSKGVVKALPVSIYTKALWDAVDRPHYLNGVLGAAEEALREGVSEISVIEFGVARGEGLLTFQEYAVAVEEATGVKIAIFGFDTGRGLPKMCGDYRDHPDRWRPGDFQMDEQWLRKQLSPRTTLLLGNVAETVVKFVQEIQTSPLGFVAFDLDFYSSTMDALQIFLLPGKRMLRRTTIYFDDTHLFYNHRFAGELLAIDEFNRANHGVKIDHWRGLTYGRPFPESIWLGNMYVAHDIQAISKMALERPPHR